MKKLQAIFVPHPPILLSEIGHGKQYLAMDTLNGLNQLAKKVEEIKPETIIFITPHGNSFSNGTSILYSEILEGNFSAFGYSDIKYSKKCNIELCEKLTETFDREDIVNILLDENTSKVYKTDMAIDHGVLVPMYFIDKYYSEYKVVLITPGGTPKEENYLIGKLIKEVVDDEGGTLVVCSGDLSHALKDDGPYTYHPASKEFDDNMQEAIKLINPMVLMNMEANIIHDAAQCGLNSFLMGLGLFDGIKSHSKLLSYEGPFGVGYLTGIIETDDNVNFNRENSLYEKMKKERLEKYQVIISAEDEYIKLARFTIEKYINTNKRPTVEEISNILNMEFIEELSKLRKGAFVSIHKDHNLRGCIGTLEPTCVNLLEEIIYCAISASSNDPRFNPIEVSELLDLTIKVDILMDSEVVKSRNELDVKEYGIILEQGNKSGVLLPNLDGVDTIEQQIDITKQKAGITTEKDMVIKRFKVIRHEV